MEIAKIKNRYKENLNASKFKNTNKITGKSNINNNNKGSTSNFKRLSSRRETFAESIFAMMTSQVIVKVLGLFYKLYVTNRSGFGDEGNAIANAGFQVYALVLSFTSMGIPGAISKIIAEKLSIGDNRGANKVLKISLIIFSSIGLLGSYILFCLAGTIAENYLHIKETRLSIIALCPSVFFVSITAVLKGYFSGRESLKITAKAQGIDQFVNTFSTIALIELNIFITRKINTERMAAISNLAMTLGNLMELTFLLFQLKKILPEIREEVLSSAEIENTRIITILREILVVSLPIMLTSIIMSISKNIDSATVVKSLSNKIGYDEAKRQYGIIIGKVDPLINLPLSFNMAIITALLPSISGTKNNIEKMNKRINSAFFIGMTIVLPVTCVYFFYSKEVLNLLFPNASAGENLLKISSLSIIFITIEQINNTIFEGLEKPWVPIISIFTGVIAKAILNSILVPKTDFALGGAIGACVSTFACHIVASAISTFELIKMRKIKLKLATFLKPAFVSAIFLLTTKLMQDVILKNFQGRISFAITLVISMSTYIILLIKISKINYEFQN